MNAAYSKRRWFMFAKKDVCQRGIYIPPFGGHGKHAFHGTFTTGKPDVSRVRQYSGNGELGKLENIFRKEAAK